MPLTKLHVPKDLDSDICRKISDLLHESLVITCGVHPDDDFCIVSRYAVEDMFLHPTYLGQRDVTATVIAEITLLAGRSEAQKEALYEDFRRGLERISLLPNNAIIYLTENAPVDWSFSNLGSVKRTLERQKT